MKRLFDVQPDFGRLGKVLSRDGEPDIVPFCEFWVDAEVMSGFVGKPVSIETAIEFFYVLGYDFVPVGARFGYKRREIQADDGVGSSRRIRTFVDENKGTIENRKDFNAYSWPTVDSSVAFPVNRTTEMLPDGMKAIVITPGGILENVMWLMGYMPLSYAIYEDEQLVYDMFEIIGINHLNMMRTLLEKSDRSRIGGIVMGDDMGFNHSTMFSPDFLRKYVFGWQKRFVNLVHEYNLPFILHSCGNVNSIMDELIDYVGIDAKHSFEDNILSVNEAKKKYGNRIALLGGVDVHFLCTATTEQIIDYVDHVINVCAPGGGFALGTGSSFTNYMPVKSWMTMLEEGRRKGIYPIMNDELHREGKY